MTEQALREAAYRDTCKTFSVVERTSAFKWGVIGFLVGFVLGVVAVGTFVAYQLAQLTHP